MNAYFESICEAKNKIKAYLDTIYQVSGDELLLELEHYNLLTNPNNCIETSTAVGFILEEFITSKLEIYTKKFNENSNEIVIKKITTSSTTNYSFDCYGLYKNILFLVNIKVQKEGSTNNAIAAINRIYKDYVEENIDNTKLEKSYLILKTHYNFAKSKRDGERKISIKGTHCYALEEIDFSKGILKDHRNWSKTFNENSGRLQIPKQWLVNRRLPDSEISYSKTKDFLTNIYNGVYN